MRALAAICLALCVLMTVAHADEAQLPLVTFPVEGVQATLVGLTPDPAMVPAKLPLGLEPWVLALDVVGEVGLMDNACTALYYGLALETGGMQYTPAFLMPADGDTEGALPLPGAVKEGEGLADFPGKVVLGFALPVGCTPELCMLQVRTATGLLVFSLGAEQPAASGASRPKLMPEGMIEPLEIEE